MIITHCISYRLDPDAILRFEVKNTAEKDNTRLTDCSSQLTALPPN